MGGVVNIELGVIGGNAQHVEFADVEEKEEQGKAPERKRYRFSLGRVWFEEG